MEIDSDLLIYFIVLPITTCFMLAFIYWANRQFTCFPSLNSLFNPVHYISIISFEAYINHSHPLAVRNSNPIC